MVQTEGMSEEDSGGCYETDRETNDLEKIQGETNCVHANNICSKINLDNS